MRKRTATQGRRFEREVLPSWEGFCRSNGRRYAAGIVDAEDLANEARLVLWEIFVEGHEPSSPDFAALAKTIVPHRLIQQTRWANAAKRDQRATGELVPEELPVRHAAPSREDAILSGVDGARRVERLRSSLPEDERRLLDYFMSDELPGERVYEGKGGWGHKQAYKRHQGGSGYTRPGRSTIAASLGWTCSRYRRVCSSLKAKVAAEPWAEHLPRGQ